MIKEVPETIHRTKKSSDGRHLPVARQFLLLLEGIDGVVTHDTWVDSKPRKMTTDGSDGHRIIRDISRCHVLSLGFADHLSSGRISDCEMKHLVERSIYCNLCDFRVTAEC